MGHPCTACAGGQTGRPARNVCQTCNSQRSPGRRPQWGCLAHAPARVTVQVVKTGITPQLATSARLREAETELLHPAGRLHTRWSGAPRRCAAVPSEALPRSSCFRQSASPLRSACQSSPCARARRDGSISQPCYWSVPHLPPVRTSTMPGAASGGPDRSRRSWAPHTGCPLPTVAPPLGAVGSYTTETSIVFVCPHAPDATTQTSGAPAPARRHRSPRSAHHGCASLQNPAANAPSTADAIALGTSCTHCNDPSPECRKIAHPIAHGPPGPLGTSAPETPSRGSSPPPITRLVCLLCTSSSRLDTPRLARARRSGLPRRAQRPLLWWPAPTG